MSNPFLTRASKGDHGEKSEKRVAKSLSAQLQPNSGAMRGAKGDSRMVRANRKFLNESKSTIKDSLSVEMAWLTKIAHEAAGSGSIPVLTLSFVTPEGKPRMHANSEWICVPSVFFKELLEDHELSETSSSKG